MSTNTSSEINHLKYFTHATTLKQIGHPRLTRFFSHFATDLEAANITIPGHEPSNDEYYVAVAAILASPTVPEPLRDAMTLMELLVAPENVRRLDESIERHLTAFSLPRTQPAVDRALELWFSSSEALNELGATCTDRCIVFRMQRKTANERCERIKDFNPLPLQRKCARFVLDHAEPIAIARPALPSSLNDRAADIWEPLLVLADLAGGDWPDLARKAAVAMASSAQDHNPVGSLLLDILAAFAHVNSGGADGRIFSRTLVVRLNHLVDRPWMELNRGRPITDAWLSQRLRPYGIRPKTIRIGEIQAKGYSIDDCMDAFRRYIPRPELDALIADSKPLDPPHANPGPVEGSAHAPTPTLSYGKR
jgi:hypothetical protein